LIDIGLFHDELIIGPANNRLKFNELGMTQRKLINLSWIQTEWSVCQV